MGPPPSSPTAYAAASSFLAAPPSCTTAASCEAGFRGSTYTCIRARGCRPPTWPSWGPCGERSWWSAR
eukprot:2828584-Pyramimonas_sp.AAC.1